MSQTIFPTLLTDTFIPQLWSFSTGFTREYADLHYVKFPIAQGSQSFPLNLSVTGTTSLGATTTNNLTISNKISYTTPQNIVRRADGTQTIAGSGTQSIVLFPTSVYDFANANIGYSAGTFTNNNSTTISVMVNASISKSGTQTIGTAYGFYLIVPALTGFTYQAGFQTVNITSTLQRYSSSISSIVRLAPGEVFRIEYYNGGTNTDTIINDAGLQTYISLMVF